MADLIALPKLLETFPWLTERRVRSMVAERRVPHWKVHNRLLFDPTDFQAMLDAGYVPPADLTPQVARGGRGHARVSGRSRTGRDEGPPAGTEGPSSQ